MRQRIRNVFQSKGLRESLLLAVGNAGASGFSAISLIILSRYLGPQSFGGFSVAFSLTQLVARILDMGSSLALQRFLAANHIHNPVDSKRAIWRIGMYKTVAALLAVAFGLLFGNLLAARLFHVSDPVLVVIGIVMGAVIVLYEYVLSIVQALSKFMMAVGMNAVQAVIKSVMAVVSWFLILPNPVTAYIWYGVAPLAAVLTGFLSVQSWFKQMPSKASVDNELFRVAKFAAVGVLAMAIGDNVDVLMVNSALTEYETGLYAAASRVALMVIMFATSFGTVFNIRAAKYRNTTDLKAFLRKSGFFAIGSMVAIPLFLLLSRPLLILTAGAEYASAVTVLNYLMAASFVTMAVMPYLAVFYAVDYPLYFAISGVIQTVLIVGCNALLLPVIGIEGAGIAKLVARIGVLLYTVAAAYKYANRQFGTGHPFGFLQFWRNRGVKQVGWSQEVGKFYE